MKRILHTLAVSALALALPLAALAAETATEAKPAEKSADKPAAKPAAKPAKKGDKAMPNQSTSPVVVMKTSLGEVKIKLDKDKAPATTDNFLKYVSEKFYDGTIFHRVIDGFMIQGGGFTPDMNQKKTNPAIALEAKTPNKRGTIAMARTNDPNSATAQFFINLKDNAFLNRSDANPGYAVFGKVVSGMDVVDKISQVKTGPSPADSQESLPTTPVVIKSAKVQK